MRLRLGPPRHRRSTMAGCETLTVPGDNDHDFYVLPAQPAGSRDARTFVAAGAVAILVHNCGPTESWVH